MGDYSGRFGTLDGSGRKLIRENATTFGLKSLLRSNLSVFVSGEGKTAYGSIIPEYGETNHIYRQ